MTSQKQIEANRKNGMLGGRPMKEINQKQFESLCAIMCTEEEICSVLDVCTDTLNQWCKNTYNMGFSDTYKNKSAMGKASLRRMQFKLAEKNPSMAIFLGKNMLGQRDNPEINIENASINDSLLNIANLINNPKQVRTEQDIEKSE